MSILIAEKKKIEELLMSNICNNELESIPYGLSEKANIR